MIALIPTILIDRKAGMDTLQRELQQERELRAMEEDQVAMMLHEFNNSLAVIQSSSLIVSAYYDHLSQAAIVDHMAAVATQAAHISDLVMALSTVVRTHRPPTATTATCVDIKALAESCRQQLIVHNPQAARIAITCSSECETLNSDINILRSILINLLSNAVKYSTPESPIVLNIESTIDSVILSLSDHGIGIPREELEKVFAPFYRASNAVNVTGTGLGLAIIKSGVGMLGGYLHVESEINQGTVFTTTLPRRGRSKVF